jgi:hypothetical protein
MLVMHVHLCCSAPKQAYHNFSISCNFPITNCTFILHTHTHTHRGRGERGGERERERGREREREKLTFRIR